MLQKKTEGILFSAEIRVVGSYTDRLLTGKALSFWLEFIDKTDEKVFCLQMQIKIKSCVTLFSWLLHK